MEGNGLEVERGGNGRQVVVKNQSGPTREGRSQKKKKKNWDVDEESGVGEICA